jgi:hypothetical protein
MEIDCKEKKTPSITKKIPVVQLITPQIRRVSKATSAYLSLLQ